METRPDTKQPEEEHIAILCILTHMYKAYTEFEDKVS